jgi:hypothetical protein
VAGSRGSLERLLAEQIFAIRRATAHIGFDLEGQEARREALVGGSRRVHDLFVVWYVHGYEQLGRRRACYEKEACDRPHKRLLMKLVCDVMSVAGFESDDLYADRVVILYQLGLYCCIR